MNPALFLALLIVALTACKKQTPEAIPSAAPAPGATAQAEPPMGAPVTIPSQPVVVPENSDVNATLEELSLQLRNYVSSTRSLPKDFQDFVARAHVQAPTPPAGKQYAISHGKVVLVNH